MKETSFFQCRFKHRNFGRGSEESHESALHEGGISEFVKQINQKTALHEDVIQGTGTGMSEKGEVSVDLALQWSTLFQNPLCAIRISFVIGTEVRIFLGEPHSQVA